MKTTSVEVSKPDYKNSYFSKKQENTDIENTWKEKITNLNACSQKGLVERFDNTIGGNTVLMPFGGKYALTPEEGMCARIPTENRIY